jgi:hypothetical protein
MVKRLFLFRRLCRGEVNVSAFASDHDGIEDDIVFFGRDIINHLAREANADLQAIGRLREESIVKAHPKAESLACAGEGHAWGDDEIQLGRIS